MIRFSALICSLVLICGTPAVAKDKAKGKSDNSAAKENKHSAKPDDKSANEKTGAKDATETAPKPKIVISTSEREVIQSYVTERSIPAKPGKKPKGLPPGLAKKLERGGSLPPGWEKKFVVGETVPPDVFKICVPLPRAITVKLPPPPTGTILIGVEGKIARIEKETKKILDVFEPPLPPLPPLPKP